MAEGGGEEQTNDARNGKPDVFISYASADKAAAESICAELERGGIVCWIAPRNVTPGVFYADAIVQAINSAQILVVVLSVNSVGSQHVLLEVERASAKRRRISPRYHSITHGLRVFPQRITLAGRERRHD